MKGVLLMKKTGLAVFIIFAACSLFGAATTSERCALAEKYIEDRYLDWSLVDKGGTELEGLLKEEQNNLKANLLLSRVWIFRGDKAASNDEKIKCYDKAAELGKAAMVIDPNSADAHFYYAAGIGRNAQLKGIFNALGVVGEVKKEMDRTIELDPKHVIGLNALAQYYMEVPGIFGGSIEKSEELLLRAKEIAPNQSMTYVTLATVYMRQGKRDKAKDLCGFVLNMKEPTKKAYYILNDKPEAERLLRELSR